MDELLELEEDELELLLELDELLELELDELELDEEELLDELELEEDEPLPGSLPIACTTSAYTGIFSASVSSKVTGHFLNIRNRHCDSADSCCGH